MAVASKNISKDLLSFLLVESKKDQNDKTKVVSLYEEIDGRHHVPFLWGKKYEHDTNNNWKRMNLKYGGKLMTKEEGKDQVDVVNESLSILKKQGSCYVAPYCGFGKTHLGCAIAAELGYETLFLSHRRLISNGWNEIFTQVFGITPITFDDYLKGKKKCPVVVASALKVAKTDPKKLENFGTVIVDEALYFCTPELIKSLLRTRPKYLVGLCAEWKRQDGLHKILPFFFGDEKNYIKRINTKPFHVYKYQTNIVPPLKYQRWTGKLDWNHIINYISEHSGRNKMIATLCQIFSKNKILILCKRKSHCDALYEILKNLGDNVSVLYGSTDTFNSSRILISTFSKTSIGFDDKNACIDFDGQRLDLLITASDTENIEQAVGRIMRTIELPRVIDIVDDFSSLKKHWSKRMNFYKTRNGIIHEETIRV